MTCFILGIKRWIGLQVEARLKMANMNRQCMTVGIIRSCRNWNSWWAEAYAWPWETDLEAKLARCYNDLVGTDELGRGKLRRLLSFPVASLLWGNVWEVQNLESKIRASCLGLLMKQSMQGFIDKTQERFLVFRADNIWKASWKTWTNSFALSLPDVRLKERLDCKQRNSLSCSRDHHHWFHCFSLTSKDCLK